MKTELGRRIHDQPVSERIRRASEHLQSGSWRTASPLVDFNALRDLRATLESEYHRKKAAELLDPLMPRPVHGLLNDFSKQLIDTYWAWRNEEDHLTCSQIKGNSLRALATATNWDESLERFELYGLSAWPVANLTLASLLMQLHELEDICQQSPAERSAASRPRDDFVFRRDPNPSDTLQNLLGQGRGV